MGKIIFFFYKSRNQSLKTLILFGFSMKFFRKNVEQGNLHETQTRLCSEKSGLRVTQRRSRKVKIGMRSVRTGLRRAQRRLRRAGSGVRLTRRCMRKVRSSCRVTTSRQRFGFPVVIPKGLNAAAQG